jgi:predicted metal-binding protein
MRGPATPVAELVLCETCRRAPVDPARPTTDGAELAELVRVAIASRSASFPVRLTRTRCLWACARSCAVHVRAPGKPGYVLSELEPTAQDAEGLVEYARLYAASPDGAVPFKTWPDAVRGHFLCRIPAVPLPPSPPDSEEEQEQQ